MRGLQVCDGDVVLLRENELIYLPLGRVDQLADAGRILVEIVAIQTGLHLEEDDFVHVDDEFSRHGA